MKNSQHIIVAGLAMLAIILAVLLVVVQPPQVARGDNSASLGDFTLMVAGPSPGTEESILTIVDNRSQRALTYELVNNQFRVVGGIDLAKVFAAGPGKAP